VNTQNLRAGGLAWLRYRLDMAGVEGSNRFLIFLLITVFLLIRHAKKLPKYYVIEIVDTFGRNIILEDLRINFSTYDAAKSYSSLVTLFQGMLISFISQNNFIVLT
jgi:hypothetical protein